MTAVTDWTAILTAVKGSTPTNPQILAVTNALLQHSFRPDVVVDTPTNEQKAQACINALRALIRADLRKVAEQPIYAAAIRQPHFAADQAALLAAVKPTADAAGAAAEADL
jgi:hypothetical protein